MRRRWKPGLVARRAALGCVALAAALLALASAGAAFGRFHVVAAGTPGPGVDVAGSSVAVVVPVSPPELRAGDVVSARVDGGGHSLYRVEAVDSWTHDVYVLDRGGRLAKLAAGDTAGRVAREIPHLGVPYRVVAGTVPGLGLLAVAAVLAAAAIGRRRRAPAGSGRGGSPWWARVAAAVVWSIGVMALTASASFTGTATLDQGAVTTGALQLEVPAAGASNRLTLGASALAPGDLVQRALDLNVSAGTTSGIVTGVTLQIGVAASTPGAGGAQYTLHDNTSESLRMWVQKCSTDWTETDPGNDGIPPFTYQCGGSTSDVLGANLPSEPPANACPPASGTVTTVNTVAGGAQALSNLTLTPGASNDLVVFLCLPTAADDNYQDASSTLTFTFAGVQRAGTDK